MKLPAVAIAAAFALGIVCGLGFGNPSSQFSRIRSIPSL
jgi:hypothetical protein